MIDYVLDYGDADPLSSPDLFVTIKTNPKEAAPETIEIQNPFSIAYANKLIGIAIDGIPIYSGLIAAGVDAFSPTLGAAAMHLDRCGGSYGMTSDGYRYHYRALPVCLLRPRDGARDSRRQSIDSVHDLFAIYEEEYDTTVPTIIGYSLQGWPIYTPYSERGLQVTGLDNCNGKYTNGSYAYFATPVFPYLKGCDGPGAYFSDDEDSSREQAPRRVSTVAYKACEGGEYFSGDSNACAKCPGGKYSTVSYAAAKAASLAESVTCNMDCPVGFYCPAGSTSPLPCPAGRFGDRRGASSSSCAGSCRLGYFCPLASTAPDTYVCGNATFYCPAESGLRLAAKDGFYSAPLSVAATMRYSQLVCDPGFYCVSGDRFPCPAGTYNSKQGANSSDSCVTCPLGSYCEQSAIAPAKCPAGTYGASLGLGTAACSGLCSPGYFCEAASTSPTQSPCPGGIYGAEYGLTSSACNTLCEDTIAEGTSVFCQPRSCSEGYFCGNASTSATQSECGGEDHYCPIGSVKATPASIGFYTVGHASPPASMQSDSDSSTRFGQVLCEPGYYCIQGHRSRCPQGFYGDTYGLSTSTCSGKCFNGYICDEASSDPRQHPCSISEDSFCPSGSFLPQAVPSGHYSVGGTPTTRGSVTVCPQGYYCLGGSKIACPAGNYGSTIGLDTAECSGRCDAGYYCPLASTSAQQVACPAGRYGAGGDANAFCTGSCRQGYYCPNASTTAFQNECGADSVYCPHQSSKPTSVTAGSYSAGQNATIRTTAHVCEVGTYWGTPPAANSRENVCPSTTV